VEPDPLGFINRVHLTTGHSDASASAAISADAPVGDLPVRATIEVQQGDVHTTTLILDLHYKVNR